MAADAHTPPKPVDVLAILNPPRHHIIGGPQWRFVEQTREPKPLPPPLNLADATEQTMRLDAVSDLFDHHEALFKTRVPAGQAPPRFAVLDAAELEACRALVTKMTAALARIAFTPADGGRPTPDQVALWRSEAREIAREALVWLPTERVIAEEVERGVQVMKNGMAWGLEYADGQVSANGWIKPTDAPIHDARYVKKPMDVCGGTWTTAGRELHRHDVEQLKGASIVSVERRTTVSLLR